MNRAALLEDVELLYYEACAHRDYLAEPTFDLADAYERLKDFLAAPEDEPSP